MTSPRKFTAKDVRVAIEVVRELPYLRERSTLDLLQAEVNCQRISADLIKLYQEMRDRERPKVQVRKRFSTVAGRDTWCLIEPGLANRPPMWPPAHWGWRETFDRALRLANERTEH
ncbi:MULTISPECIES: hypothetical protein [Rhodococcus]|uniref:hypothetical protein n=1 Tax=Rhodococcus TaxID=1827 RepID=UPI001E4A921B|nr:MULTISPECIES: hypothetical protein [Rhodococcus]BDB58962.1 hypothetical protein RDE2_07560 [Rhodococcus sp. RDE2]